MQMDREVLISQGSYQIVGIAFGCIRIDTKFVSDAIQRKS